MRKWIFFPGGPGKLQQHDPLYMVIIHFANAQLHPTCVCFAPEAWLYTDTSRDGVRLLRIERLPNLKHSAHGLS